MKRKSPGTKAVAPASATKTPTTAKRSAAKKPAPKAAKAAKPATKAAAKKKAPAKSPSAAPKKKATPKTDDSLAKGQAIEAAAAAGPKAKASNRAPAAAAATTLRNSDFPNTYIKSINVSLNDPDHWMTLVWTGPKAASQEKGPFRTSPGAGLKGRNCDNTTTSRTSGSLCTPKGTHKVQGFQSALNSDSRATNVTWFVRARGIALHYFPSVPKYAASHGCVRIEQKRVAQLIQQNARVDLTSVVIDGTWTKPPKQW